MYYSYVEIEYVATSFSPARTDLALKLLTTVPIMITKMKKKTRMRFIKERLNPMMGIPLDLAQLKSEIP